jgi:hypothetical protein
MRQPLDATRVRAFLEAFARTATESTTVYLVGGATAVTVGWRSSTIDVDIVLEPESDAMLRALPRLKDELRTNVELASPLDFLPELPGWRDRSPFVVQLGRLTVRQFDPYSQVLAKLERGFAHDVTDVRAMLDRGLVAPSELRRLFEAISGQLHRFPAIDPVALRESVMALGG